VQGGAIGEVTGCDAGWGAGDVAHLPDAGLVDEQLVDRCFAAATWAVQEVAKGGSFRVLDRVNHSVVGDFLFSGKLGK
jgi:hypothetical protein